MELYVGGAFQGKLAYVLGKKADLPEEKKKVEDWEKRKEASPLSQSQANIQNHFEKWVELGMEEGKTLEELEKEVETYIESCPDSIIICDEVGNGIVPVEEKQRRYREYVGRLLCIIAKKASHMERIICGMGQVIKCTPEP